MDSPPGKQDTRTLSRSDTGTPPPRAIWSGSISLGLVNIPVKLISMIVDSKVHFRLIHQTCKTPIHYKKVCEEGDEVPQKDILYGYPVAKNEYILLDPKEVMDAKPRSSEIIDLDSFISIFEVDPHYFDRTYLLVPDRSEAAYALLRETLKNANRAAIGKMTMHSKEHIVLIHFYRDAIVATTLRYYSEVLNPSELAPLAGLPEPGDAELAVAREIVEKLTEPLDHRKYQDEYRKRIDDLIRSRIEGKAAHIEERKQEVSVRDLMDALKMTAESLK